MKREIIEKMYFRMESIINLNKYEKKLKFNYDE